MLLKTFPWDSFKKDLLEQTPKEIKIHLLKVFTKLKIFYESKNEEKKIFLDGIEEYLLTVSACIDRTWEMLNSGYWKNVSLEYRYCYSLSCILKSLLLDVKIEMEITEDKKKSLIVEALKQIDKGILLGAPLLSVPELLTDMASKLNVYFTVLPGSFNTASKIHVNSESICTEIFSGFQPVISCVKPSMETFYCKYFKPKLPVLIKGCLEHWKAIQLWQNAEYLQSVAGNRTVPIEIGSRYTEEDWTQKLTTFSEFLQKHVLSECKEVGYLAQHQLFDQIPELKKDFSIPEYCSFSDTESDYNMPDINAWFGPGGTISPLHHDPKNNLLCQIFGYKRILLYSKDDDNLYPYESRLLVNTSKVDPYNPDYKLFPNFKKAKGYICYLKPGDMLYIPPKWWHHVVSLSPSFSISFWWD